MRRDREEEAIEISDDDDDGSVADSAAAARVTLSASSQQRQQLTPGGGGFTPASELTPLSARPSNQASAASPATTTKSKAAAAAPNPVDVVINPVMRSRLDRAIAAVRATLSVAERQKAAQQPLWLAQRIKASCADVAAAAISISLGPTIVSDRGSVFLCWVAGGVDSEPKLATLKRWIKTQLELFGKKAAHEAILVADVNGTQDDDGETGASERMARVLAQVRRQGPPRLTNVALVVTRFFGGQLLYADRFVHIDAVCRDALRESLSGETFVDLG